MKKMLLIASIVLSLLVTIPFSPNSTSVKAQTGTQTYQGSIDGAPYTIKVPASWNGTLLVLALGYRPKANRPNEGEDRTAYTTFPPGLEPALLSLGYALAGTAYKSNGYAVEEALEDVPALVKFFRKNIGKPNRTILTGFSMGGLIGLRLMEKQNDGEMKPILDGALCGCALAEGTPLQGDRFLDFAVAYDTVFGFPASWGTPNDLRDDLDFETEVIPVLMSQLSDPANFGKFEYVRLIARFPFDGFYSGALPVPHLFFHMFVITEGRAQEESRWGSAAFQNLDHTYQLSAEEKSYLASLGVDADSLLQATSAKRFSADRKARRYEMRFASLSGAISQPVLMIHNTGDGIVPPDATSVYQEYNRISGRQDNLLQLYVNGNNHCGFTQQQMLRSIQALESWINTSIKPKVESFPESEGFDHSFQPAPWPQPIKKYRRKASDD